MLPKIKTILLTVIAAFAAFFSSVVWHKRKVRKEYKKEIDHARLEKEIKEIEQAINLEKEIDDFSDDDLDDFLREHKRWTRD